MLKRCSAIFAAIELWLPTSSFPISRDLQAESLAEDWVIEGNCSVDGACVSSPNFPDPYGNKDYCLISLPKPSLVEVTAFETEKGYDKLTVNAKQFSGTSLSGESFTVWTNITWRTDESVVERGWQLCVKTLSCADGLVLTPVSVRDCPPGSQALPNCQEAAPGDLCEGDGQCGTRTDVNNCYDESFTYPASRDVYRKGDGSTRTTTATTTVPFFESGSWKITGPCTTTGDCVRSGNYPEKYGDSERCVINMPQPSVINFTAFSTESSYDTLTINGLRYSGSDEVGTVVVAWGNITWQADASVAGDGWELCFVSPKCHDGLTVTPIGVRECPPGSTVLPSCEEALPGELCNGDGSCGTRSDINNCYDAEYSYPPSRDVYRKADGSTLTTTMVTVTTTHTLQESTTEAASSGDSPWTVIGPCETHGACVQSPNYPEQYGDHQACNMSLPKPSVVTIRDFLTEPDMDFLTFHGIPFSGRGPNRRTFTLWTNITWRSDASVAERGWRICKDAPPFCSDGLPLTPVPVKDCPAGSTILPSCEEAAPGELCEGRGECGTRTDVNNCYDQYYTYPATRDVYRKFNGTASTTTTKTVTTVSTTTTSSSQSTTLLEGYWDGPAPWSISGGCQRHGACVESSGFPEGDDEEDCELSLPRPSVVRVTALDAQAGDSLVINNEAYTGKEQEGAYFTVWSPITWHSSGAGSKFQLCYEALPVCSDGLQLHPVAIPECPPVGEDLPGCDLAAPGELCEGNGNCGTRSDINNCYDASYSYPPSRDVYRKDNGTTQTTTTSISLTLTTTTSTTVTRWSSKGRWQYVGPCEVRGNCLRSPKVQDGHCTAIPPLGKPIQLVSYAGSGDLKIDGKKLHPSDQGQRYLVGSQISWSPGAGNASWELCSRAPACDDGLALTPAEECPSDVADLPGCLDVEPGGFCQAGECLTYDGLANCEGVAVYQKATGTTRTVTTTVTQTATSTASLWHVEGPCGVSGACAESPNFPEPYGLNERCTLSLPEGTQVTVTAFSTEEFYDRLTINGERYSGPQGLVGQTFTVTSPIEWRSDESNTGDGWQLMETLILRWWIALHNCHKHSDLNGVCGVSSTDEECDRTWAQVFPERGRSWGSQSEMHRDLNQRSQFCFLSVPISTIYIMLLNVNTQLISGICYHSFTVLINLFC